MQIEANIIVPGQFTSQIVNIDWPRSNHSDTSCFDETELTNFQAHYLKVKLTYQQKTHIVPMVQDLSRTHYAILNDHTFYNCILRHIKDCQSVNIGLMKFYELEIVPIYQPRIASDILGLLRVINTHNLNTIINIRPQSLICCYGLTVDQWFGLTLANIDGIIFIETAVDSHGVLIATSLNLPTAIIDQTFVDMLKINDSICNVKFCSSSNAIIINE